MQVPEGAFAIVFESGVFRFDEEGALHVHLSHGADAPHPLRTHPDGAETTVPAWDSEGLVEGSGSGGLAPEADELPEGLALTVRGCSICRVESSGDLSVLVPDASAWPSWFSEGKVHRFDGPDGRPWIWSESVKPPEPPRPSRRPPTRVEPDPGPSSRPAAASRRSPASLSVAGPPAGSADRTGRGARTIACFSTAVEKSGASRRRSRRGCPDVGTARTLSTRRRTRRARCVWAKPEGDPPRSRSSRT